MNPYSAPLDALLPLGEPAWDDWLDYRQFGLTPDHAAELTRMATDPGLNYSDPESPEVFAPVHAWRALGQLGAVQAIPDLLGLIEADEYDDWPGEDLPNVFALMGPAAVPALMAWLHDRSRGTYSRWAAADGLKRIAQRDPEQRAAVIDALTLPLTWPDDDAVNGAVVDGLCDLKAVESAAVIEAAFAAGFVDEMVVGDWPAVRHELGLGPPPPRRPLQWSTGTPRARAEERKAQRKREKKARKRDRKRR